MHRFVFGINSPLQIQFVSLASRVLVYFLIRLSTHPSHLPHSQHLSLLHFFTLGSTSPSHPNTLLPIGLDS